MDCVFCKILKGEIPCYKIYEDEDTLAFLDIAAEGEGHTLVIPKKHFSCVAEADAKAALKCIETAKHVGKHYMEKCGFSAYHLLINNGEDAGQSVMHLHVHIIPRKKDDGVETWHPKKWDEDFESVAARLRLPKFEEEVKTGKVILYTDGACSGNPGVGGFCAILQAGGKEKIISGGDKQTTNNRMELLGVIKGLEALKTPCKVDVFSDSAYVINAFVNDWISSWQANNWKTKGKTDVQNVDLWKRLIELTKTHDVSWNKVKGHADNELNNRCDQIAREEILKIKDGI